jgi:bifunctional UDP-N-acetylglucosamine pyrophosphorylase/glucosamine-1-phosphate N-acetyltransferase
VVAVPATEDFEARASIEAMTASAQAVILAAGKGTRMKSARPKALHQVLGLPMLEHLRRTVTALGVEPVTVVVGHQAEAVQKAFAGRGLDFVAQDPQLGTGHALQCAREAFARRPERTLLVLNGDLPLLSPETLLRLLEVHRGNRAAATLLTVVLDDPGAYGRVLRGTDGQVRAIVEARDASEKERAVREVNAGIYAFEVPVLLEVLSGLQPQNAQGEYYLTDLVGLLRSAGRSVHAVSGDAVEALGVNTLEDLAAATALLRQRRNAELMAAGVVIEDPASTCVGLDVQVAPDAVLRAGTLLEGRTRVAAGATIGPFARLVDTEVGEGAVVLDHCLLLESVVEEGASIGPFAHLRPQSHVGRRAKVGNFVELKKAVLGEGAKASHLSYVGDATVGPAVNIGAGTITCNYDGQDKHPTRIEGGAFVGSNTTLVAPVTVGEGAYIGAGSTITSDVPAHALALGRARQVVKKDWARRRRQGRAKK